MSTKYESPDRFNPGQSIREKLILNPPRENLFKLLWCSIYSMLLKNLILPL